MHRNFFSNGSFEGGDINNNILENLDSYLAPDKACVLSVFTILLPNLTIKMGTYLRGDIQ